MKWRRFLTILAMSILVVFGAAMSQSIQRDRSILDVATSPDYCPYEFVQTVDGIRTLVGFDIDLVKAIAQSLGYVLHFDEMHFNEVILALRSEKTDLAVAAITPTDERRKVVQFSSVYYEAKSSLVFRDRTPLEAEADLAGLKVGAKLDTVHAQRVQQWKDVEFVPFEQTGDILQSLKWHRIDAAVIDETIAEADVQTKEGLGWTTLPNEEPAGVAIAFPPNSPLVGRVNRVLRDLDASGFLDQLTIKWFDEYVCESASV